MPYSKEEIALLDLWAGQVMNGRLANGHFRLVPRLDPKGERIVDHENIEEFSKSCYEYALALLAERRRILGEGKE